MRARSDEAAVGVQDAEDFNLDQFLPYRLAVTAATVNRLMGRRLADSAKLSISEWRVLAVVGKAGVLSPSAIGATAAMDKVKVSRAAAALVARGLLKQTQDPHDGRGRLLRLTRKAITVQRGMVALARKTEAQLEGGFSRADWSALHTLLTRLESHAQGLSNPQSRAEAAD